MKTKLIVSDIDGVWTDGSFYYSGEGDVMRRFTTKDSYGIALCQLAQIPVLILSTEDNPMVRQRMQKLGVKHMSLGVENKLEHLTNFCKTHQIKLNEVAYVGDDMNDYNLLGKVGLFACPADAYKKIKERAHLILETKGGEGAFREFVEKVLEGEEKLEQAYNKYTS